MTTKASLLFFAYLEPLKHLFTLAIKLLSLTHTHKTHTYVMAGQDDVTHARCTIEMGIVAGVGHTVGRMQRDWHVRRVVLRMWQCMMQREFVTNQLKPKKL